MSIYKLLSKFVVVKRPPIYTDREQEEVQNKDVKVGISAPTRFMRHLEAILKHGTRCQFHHPEIHYFISRQIDLKTLKQIRFALLRDNQDDLVFCFRFLRISRARGDFAACIPAYICDKYLQDFIVKHR